MVEANKTSQSLQNLFDNLQDLITIKEFIKASDDVTEIMISGYKINEILGDEGSFHIDISSKYLQEFIERYQRELKGNPDIAFMLFRETLHNIKNYWFFLFEMIKGIPREELVKKENNINNQDSFVSQQNDIKPQNQKEEKKINFSAKTSKCTTERNGLDFVRQAAFHCKTCKIADNSIICQSCAVKCHAGHITVLQGKMEGFCDCRFLSSNCQLQTCCTLKVTGKRLIQQVQFICETCNMAPGTGKFLCGFCANMCHKGHKLVDKGINEGGFCDCKSLFEFCQMNPISKPVEKSVGKPAKKPRGFISWFFKPN